MTWPMHLFFNQEISKSKQAAGHKEDNGEHDV
jgi:hypothetical protein